MSPVIGRPGLPQTGGQYHEDRTFDFEVGLFTAEDVTHQVAFSRSMQCQLKLTAYVNKHIFLQISGIVNTTFNLFIGLPVVIGGYGIFGLRDI